VSIFLLQFLAIVIAINSPIKYFAWVPYDQITSYEIRVRIGDQSLSDQEVTKRYHLQNPGRENRSIYHVFSIIHQFENTYGNADRAKVEVIYSTNGAKPKTWTLEP